MKKALHIYYSNSSMNAMEEDTEYITFEQMVRIAKSKDFIRHINKYQGVVFYCNSFTSIAKAFLTAVICRLLTFGECVWIDTEGRTKKIGIGVLFKLFFVFLYENMTYKHMLKEVSKEVASLCKAEHQAKLKAAPKTPVYLRCDLAYGYIAGGSIGHIAGVLNNMETCTSEAPIFISTDVIPTVDKKIESRIIKETVPYANVKDVASIAFNKVIFCSLEDILKGKNVSFIYQRSALNAYAGIKYAIKYQIPFILEYNGSEVWISNKWGGRKLKTNDLSQKIEILTFEKADLITCVSTPLKNQLIELGIKPDKIIVTPNGVNPEMYSPTIDGTEVRKKMNISASAIVIGFIGTFGAWHGTDILVQAFAELVSQENLAVPIHLLLVGDGLKMPDVKKVIQEKKIGDLCTLTGVVPQNQGPKYLAACDILVSPQTKNADGTPFFGSPTKLFEYMAMGKAIVTSDMDQMAEIFENDKTAVLCEPGNVSALKEALRRLIEDGELRKRLGQMARAEVCSKYTWKIHVEKIIMALKSRMENANV